MFLFFIHQYCLQPLLGLVPKARCSYYGHLALLLVLSVLLVERAESQDTILSYPIITSINPTFGSIQGGTWITISGANFMSGGLFTSRLIFIGGQLCPEIPYYTTDNRIICIAPRCVDPNCLSSPTWGGNVALSLDVYVQDVEAIYGATITFSYYGGYTPAVYVMSRTVRPTAVFSVVGYMTTQYTADLQIKIGDNFAYIPYTTLGSINAETLNQFYPYQPVYYYPSPDETAGFYNLSLQSQDDQSQGPEGTGFARLFDTQPFTDNSWNYYSPCFYNWGSDLFGNAFNVVLQPVISGVFPANGSIAGGTVVTITGSGFSTSIVQNTVFVGGYICDVTVAQLELIQCVTRENTNLGLSNFIQDATTVPTFSQEVKVNSTRNYGSQGWWVNLWDYYTYSTNAYDLSNTVLNFGWKNDMLYSLYYEAGKYWASELNYNSRTGDSGDYYAADLTTYLIAPVSGWYQFYVTVDFSVTLFGTHVNHQGLKVGAEEQIFQSISADSITSGSIYISLETHKSKQIFLSRGERYYLRAFFVNNGDAVDVLQLGLAIQPNETLHTTVSQAAANTDSTYYWDQQFYNFQLRELNNSIFLNHHSLKTIQFLSLSFFHWYEIQRILITGITGGTFNLIVQDLAVTSDLSTASDIYEIGGALATAANSIPAPYIVQCVSFSVTTTLINNADGSQNMVIDVLFGVENSYPITLLSVFTGNLAGSNVTYGVNTIQTHTVLPGGYADLHLDYEGNNYDFQIGVSDDQDTVRNMFAASPLAAHVEVTRLYNLYTDYTWILTFITPRGDIPQMHVNISNVIGAGTNATLQKVQNGSVDTIWFDSLPSWLTEVPLSDATLGTLHSNVEVYVVGNTGQYLKAVCDNAVSSNVEVSFLKGVETSCGYYYSSQATPLVSESSLQIVNADTMSIDIKGNYFDLAGLNNYLNIYVTIADHNCAIDFYNATFIHCTVNSIPYGQYTPVVTIVGYGRSYTTTNTQLTFTEQVISVSPQFGSVAGGQIIHIEGRGFRLNSTITLCPHSLECEILSISTTDIYCRTPAASQFNDYSFGTESPLSSPTHAPTESPITHHAFIGELIDEDEVKESVVHHPTPEEKSKDSQTFLEDFSSLFEVSRRHLASGNPNVNYQLCINALPLPANYSYNLSATPIIQSFSPVNISSAATTNISVTFLHPLTVTNVSVTVGSEVCSQVVLISPVQLTCVLLRDVAFGAVQRVPLYVYVHGIGYAASINDAAEVPTLFRGFEISNIVPSGGSIMGGNIVVISGFGFSPSYTAAHTVSFTEVGVPPLSAYDNLLVSLGFKTLESVYPPDTFLNCVPVAFSFTNITCYIPGHSTVYNQSAYNVAVTLNQATSFCANNITSCEYVQDLTYTPEINKIKVLSSTATGVYTIQVTGTLFTAGTASATVQGLPATITSLTGNTMTIVTSPLAVGHNMVNLSIDGYGYSLSNATFYSTVSIASVLSNGTTKGSVAGGTLFILEGHGFSSTCAKNWLNFVVDFSSSIYSYPVTEYVSCTTTELQFYSPSVLSQVALGDGALVSVQYNDTQWNTSHTEINFGTPPFGTPPFTYSLSYTPTVVVNATQGYTNQHLKLVITDSGVVAAPTVDTRIGSAACGNHDENVKTISAGVFEQICVVPFITASLRPYSIYANVHPVGYAIVTTPSKELPPFTTDIYVNPITTIQSSVEGGSNLTISGYGFPADTVVDICGSKCLVNGTITDTTFTCTIPSRLTVDAVDTLQSQGIFNDFTSTVQGAYFSSLGLPNSPLVANAHDGNYNTYFEQYNLNCYIGVEIEPGYVAQPYRMRFYPRLSYANYVNKYVFEGLPDNSAVYIPLAYSQFAEEGWNYLDPTSNTTTWFTAFRYRALDVSPAYSECMLAEVQFLATVAKLNDTCSVVVKSNSTSFSQPIGTVYYSYSETPQIFSISPSNGTALGGTTVTIIGKGFNPIGAGGVDVKFSGIDCPVVSSSSTEIICVTNPRPPEAVETSSIKVTIGGRGLAMVPDSVEFLYIDKWSALTSWKYQEPPVNGDVVWLPDGQVILLDESTPLLTFLLVQGSLYFDCTQHLLTVDTYYFFVLGGYLEIGTHESPCEGNVIITLYGDRYKTIDMPMVGDKFLAVAARGLPSLEFSPGIHVPSRYQGQLEIHGKVRLRTWTYVEYTANAGSWNITTSEPVDYAAGEQIVLTGNGIPSSTTQAGFGYEQLTVAKTVDNKYVYFTTPLQYNHPSFKIEIEGRIVDMRCQIGLLTRNILIQGDDIVSDGQLYGAHTIAFHSGIYRIENAEFTRCGQAFNFGRYCTHSHEAGNMEGSYVKANSIHHSYQRAVTTHDTSNWEVRDNVAFDIQGHAYFVEDGSERNNYITGNLGVHIIQSSALLLSDMEPAVFWTATPTNFWRDNVAAHSVSSGFWFEPATVSDDNCPVNEKIGEFMNITVHSNGNMGLRIYPQWTPLQDSCGGSIPDPQYLYHLLSYHNGGNGIFGYHHGDIHHVYPYLVENGGDEYNQVHYDSVNYTKLPTLENALLVGVLPQNYVSGMNLGKYAIFGPQSEFFYGRNITFVNYGSSGAITGCNDCLGSSTKQGAFTTRYEQLKFVNTDLRLVWNPTYKEIIWDLDGTLGGVADSMITFFYEVINWPDVCTVLPAATYSNSLRCGGNGSKARIRRVQLTNFFPSGLSYTNVHIRSAVGATSYSFLPEDVYGWVFAAVTGHNKNYTYSWVDAGESTYQMDLTLGVIPYLLETYNDPAYVENVEIVYTPYPWDYIPFSFATVYNGVTKYIPWNYTLPLLHMANGQFDNTTVRVLLTNTGANLADPSPFEVQIIAEQCPPLPGGCRPAPTPMIGNPMLWSDKNSWPSGKLPVGGSKVTIAADMWIVLDISPPKLQCIIIYGRLSFESNATHPKDLTLTTNCIEVWGQFEITAFNDTSAPFIGNANVVLYGTKGQSVPVTMAAGVFLGSKVIASVGQVIMKGQPKNTTWVKLAETASSGNTSVTLQGEVPWEVGDEIAIAPTSYFTEIGKPWFYNVSTSPADEVRTISTITRIIKSGKVYTKITFGLPLAHSHICEVIDNHEFCGAVGVLTHNIQFSSTNSETPGQSYGFGGHFFVFDIPTANPPSSGSLILENVELKYFGQINTDYYAITFLYSATNPHIPPNSIKNCSFNLGYNFAVHATNAKNLTFSNNVATRNWGGGVYYDPGSILYTIENNLIIGTRQLPSVLLSLYPWVRPIAGLTVLNNQGVIRNNLIAGSEDQGFTIATSLFHVNPTQAGLCTITSGTAYSYQSLLPSISPASFEGNEAVAGKGGLFLLAVSSEESSPYDCSVVIGFVAWRNAHAGITSADSESNILIARSVLAENYIGLLLHFYKSNTVGFSGIVNSTVIASLASTSSNEGVCADLPDSLYLPGFQCHVFSQSDPLAQSLSCESDLVNIYRRVGLLIPTFTNAPRTCAISGAFSPCDPPNTPARLCSMPWEKRYGLPIPAFYAEFHIHDMTFIGYKTTTVADPTTGQNCIPTTDYDRSVAIATNPTELDTQPTIITSGLNWKDDNLKGRIGFDQGGWVGECEGNYPCQGQQMLLIHDLDGSFNNQSLPGQLYYNNPEYGAQYPQCYEAPYLSSKVYLCPTTVNIDGVTTPFEQYSALWYDQGPQVIQPIIVTRRLPTVNVSYPSFGPIGDLGCSERDYFSQFNLFIVKNQINYVMSTGTVPPAWYLRWDAPSEQDVAIIDFFIDLSQVIYVYVGSGSTDLYSANWELVPHKALYPNLTAPAGYNQRNPQARSLSVTIRGGEQRFYQFVIQPIASVTITMDMSIEQFYSNTFIANLCLLLGILPSQVAIIDVRKGSVIVDFTLSSALPATNLTSIYEAQIKDINEILANLTIFSKNGKLEQVLNVTVEQITVTPPLIPQIFNELYNPPANSTYNGTLERIEEITKGEPVSYYIYGGPSSAPSSTPSSQPSSEPSLSPTTQDDNTFVVLIY